MTALVQSSGPLSGPSWEEEVVPALRKRLESESRTLDRRMSAVSLSSQEESQRPNFFALSDTTIPEYSSPMSPILQSNASATHSRPVFPVSRPSDRTISPASSQVNGTNTTTTTIPPIKKPPSPSFRSRTYSQPYLTNGKTGESPRLTSNKSSKSPIPELPRSHSPRQADSRPTRIPKASRGPIAGSSNHNHSPPMANGNGYHYTSSPEPYNSSDLHAVHENLSYKYSRPSVDAVSHQTPGLLDEPAPFHPSATSSIVASSYESPLPEERDEAAPRHSNDSEEHPFEHWYRGEVSRNGGVGELRVGRRQEMLDIANYGHTIKSKALISHMVTPNAINDGKRRRTRADSVSGLEAKARERDSLYLDDDNAREIGQVLDESPLTDLDGDGSDIGSASEHYTSIHSDYYNITSEFEDLSATSAPIPNTYEHRSTTPTSLQRQSSRQHSAPPTRIPRPPSRQSSDSRVPTPTPMSRGSSEPPLTSSTSTSKSPVRQRQQSKPTPASGKQGVSVKSVSPPQKSKTATSKATRAKLLAAKKEQEDEANRRSVAHYPTPTDGDEIMIDAIPSWTQPVPREGNWDDVVLPVVARKRGLEGHYEKADGNPTPKKANNTVEPAPGTFGFDHSKYRRPRDPESIPMDEFGRPATQIIEEWEQEEPTPLTSSRIPPNIHEEIPLPVRQERPQSSAPFAHYAPMSEKVTMPLDSSENRQDVEQIRQNEEEKGAGCCSCVIM